MGVVYLAKDRERGQEVALKTLRQLDAPTLLHFKREFRALAGISHPNLVSLYELFHVDDQWFFTMEPAEGVSFNEWVRPGNEKMNPASALDPATVVDGIASVEDATIDQAIETMLDVGVVDDLPDAQAPLDIGRLRGAFGQLVSGVDALHRSGRLHRDLKPSNVRVLPSGRVVILDFGLVAEMEKDDEHVSTSSRIVGTAGYMSPEQAAGRRVSAASDWYAVGSMLYEALTGTRPFVGPVLDVLVQKSQTDGPSPRLVDAGIPDDLDALVVGLLKKTPDERPTGEWITSNFSGGDDGALRYRERPMAAAKRPLVGRESELERLQRAFLSTDEERAAVVWVRGESGMGKSALVAHFCETLGSLGNGVVLRGACHEHEAVRYRAFDSVVDALARYLEPIHKGDTDEILPPDIDALVRLFPVLRIVPAIEERVSARLAGQPTVDVEPREVQLRAFRALRALLTSLAKRMPVVIWIDDLQWGDRDSAPLFSEILSPPDPPHLMLIGSYRTEDGQKGPLVSALERESAEEIGPVERIDLDPLSFDQARSLARRLLDDATEDVEGIATSIARESGGSPYFIVEILRHLDNDAAGRMTPVAATDDGRGFSRTAMSANLTLDEVLRSRIDELPGAARAVLEVVAVAARPLPKEVIHDAASLSAKTGVVWRLLESGNLVRTSIDSQGIERISAYHPRIREVISSRLSIEDHTLIHARLAVAIRSRTPEDSESLALHYHGAEEPALAAEYAVKAATAAANGLAFDRAAELYGLASSLDPEPTVSLRRLRAQALADAGRGLEAAEAFLALARDSSGSDALELRRLAAEQLLRTGHVDRGFEALQHVLDDIGMSLSRSPNRALASLVRSRMAVRLRGLRFRKTPAEQIDPARLSRVDILWSVATGLAMVDSTIGTDFQSRHLVEALELGEPYRVARALAMEACYSATGGVGTRRRTSKVVALADELATSIDSPHALGLAKMASGAAAFLEGRFEDGRSHSAEAEQILRQRCVGVLWEIATTHIFHLLSLAFLGEFGALDDFVRKNVREAQSRNDRYAMANLRSGAGNLAYLVRDDPEGAHRALDETRGHLPAEGFALPHFYELLARINLLLYERRWSDAYAAVESVRTVALKAMVMRVQYLRVDVCFAFARVSLAASAVAADPDKYLDEATAFAGRLSREPASWAPPLGMLVQAGISERRRRYREAADAYLGAAAAAEAQHLGHIVAASKWRAGALKGGTDGAALINEARTFFRDQRVSRPERLARVFAPATSTRD